MITSMENKLENVDIWASARSLLGTDGKLSVIMPAYGLGNFIEKNIRRVSEVLEGKIPYEILPVDDGSEDNTASAIRQAAEANPDHVVPVYLKVNGGKGNALKRGFAESTGSHVLFLDADLDLSPMRIPLFFQKMEREKVDVIVGSKRHPDSNIDYPWRRRLASFVYYSIVRILIGLPLHDTQTGMKLFRREVLQYTFDRMLVKRFAFDVELLSIAHNKGYRIAEAPIEMNFGNKAGSLNAQNVRDVMVDTIAIFYREKILHYYRSVEVVPQLEKPPRVSVVIACPGTSTYLEECLAGLAVQTYTNFEVIVLPDEPLDLGKRTFDCRVIPTGKVRPAEKRNLGIERSDGEIIAFLDDDAYPIPNWLETAVKYFSVPEIGGVGGPGATPPNDPFLAQLSGRVFDNLLVSGNYRYRYKGDRVRSSIDDYPSCNLFVRKNVLQAIGGYNTRFWPGEDTILCRDIVFDRKKRIVYDPWALVYHHRRSLFLPHLRQIGRYGLHRGYFAKRFPQTSLRLSYLVPSLFVLGLVGGAAICWLHTYLFYLYLGCVGFYLLLTFLSCVSRNPVVWFLTWFGVVSTHVWYGIRFALGLLSRRMPCEVRSFDHGPQQTGG